MTPAAALLWPAAAAAAVGRRRWPRAAGIQVSPAAEPSCTSACTAVGRLFDAGCCVCVRACVLCRVVPSARSRPVCGARVFALFLLLPVAAATRRGHCGDPFFTFSRPSARPPTSSDRQVRDLGCCCCCCGRRRRCTVTP